MRVKNIKTKNLIGALLAVIALLSIVLIATMASATDIWYDEVFSMCFSTSSIRELIALTAADVHPPFYYIYLKLMAGIISAFGLQLEVAAKLSSIIPWIGLFVIALTYIRKKWGMLVAGIFTCLVTVMPQIGNYYIEIRMYSLALFMITLAGLMAFKIAEDDRVIFWITLFAMGILCAYTQYYACIGIIGVYLGLLVLIFRDKKKLIKWGICAIGSVLLYIPWLPSLFGQMGKVNGNYWIQPLTVRSIAGCVKFITLPVSLDGKICLISAGLTIAAIAVLVILTIKDDIKTVVAMLMPLFIIILSGFILSAMGTPIFVYRYMVPALGLMWLWVAIMIDKVSERFSWGMIFLIPFILGGILTMRGMYAEEHKKVVAMEDVNEAFEALADNPVIICNFDHVASVAGYYLRDADVYLYEADIDELLPKMLNGTGTFIDDAGVADIVKSGRPVYFFGSFVSRDEILDNWKTLGIDNVEDASILLERYWFNIYRLSNEE